MNPTLLALAFRLAQEEQGNAWLMPGAATPPRDCRTHPELTGRTATAVFTSI